LDHNLPSTWLKGWLQFEEPRRLKRMSHDITVQQLRDYLECVDSELPVRIATQRTYPLQSHIVPVVKVYRGVAYILEEDQVYEDPYLPKSLWDEGEAEACDNCQSTRVVGTVASDDSGERYPICEECLRDEVPPSVAGTLEKY
jgi:hypothetical protein